MQSIHTKNNHVVSVRFYVIPVIIQPNDVGLCHYHVASKYSFDTRRSIRTCSFNFFYRSSKISIALSKGTAFYTNECLNIEYVKDVNDDLLSFWILKKLINKWSVIFASDDKPSPKIIQGKNTVNRILNMISHYWLSVFLFPLDMIHFIY